MSRETDAWRKAIATARAEGHAAGVAEGRREALAEAAAYVEGRLRDGERGRLAVEAELGRRPHDRHLLPERHRIEGRHFAWAEVQGWLLEASREPSAADAPPVSCGAPGGAPEGVDVSAAGAGVAEAREPGDGRGGGA